MKFCSSCGSPLHENAMFCSACGTPVVTQTEDVSQVNTKAEINANIDAQPTENFAGENGAGNYVNAEKPAANPEKTTKSDFSEETNGQAATIEVPARPRKVEVSPSKPEISPAPQIQPEKPMTTPNVYCGQAQSGSSIGVKVISIFLCLILGVAIFAASSVGIVRNTISSASVDNLVEDINIDNIEDVVITDEDGDEKPLTEVILDFCDPTVKKQYNLNEDTVVEVLKNTGADEFIGDVLSDYSAYLIDGDELEALNGERVVGWIRENEENIEDVIQYEFTENDYVKLEADIDNSEVIRAISEKGMKDAVGGNIQVVRAGLSVWVYALLVGIAVVLGALIVVMNKRKVKAFFTYVTVTLTVIGTIYLIVTGGLLALTAFVLPEFVTTLLGSLLLAISLRGGVMFVFGLASTIICKIICDKKRRALKAKI